MKLFFFSAMLSSAGRFYERFKECECEGTESNPSRGSNSFFFFGGGNKSNRIIVHLGVDLATSTAGRLIKVGARG